MVMDPSSTPVQSAPDLPPASGGSLQEMSDSAPARAEKARAHEDAAAKALETMGSGPAFPSTGLGTTPVAPAAPPPPPDPGAIAAVPLVAGSPIVAEDSDLIEPEWVDKAKEIVERTHDDPHLQNKEINKFKADYLMKRYKKQIKVNEE